MTRYTQLLGIDIWKFVITTHYPSSAALNLVTRRCEIKQETKAQKRKAAQAVVPVS